MHQLLSLRPGASGKLDDSPSFAHKWRFDSLQEMLLDPEKALAQVPLSERYNLYFTPNHSNPNKKREFESGEYLYFDIDKGVDLTRVDKYQEALCDVLKLPVDAVACVCSGNGLHFYIHMERPFTSPLVFKELRMHYKAVAAQIDARLAKENLPGECDTSVFDRARLMRMPGSLNKKPDKETKACFVVQPRMQKFLIDLPAMSRIPKVKAADALHPEHMKKLRFVDNRAIFENCGFMRHCRDFPQDVTEPQWYAMLSISTRMNDGAKLSHELSKGHAHYSERDTEQKISQAIEASPPRKCKSIAQNFEGCSKCPLYQKIESPITIVSEDAIPTENTGFHEISYNAEGVPTRPKPCYKDLRKFFERKFPFVTHSKICWTWNGTHYDVMRRNDIRQFAQDHFNPFATIGMSTEFEDLIITRSNGVDPETWAAATQRKINFSNGVLDLETLELLPHSPGVGFKYCLPYDYDPEAKAPLFEKFMHEITLGSENLTKTLMEFGGYSLSGDDCSAAKALFLVGEGANGKSTFVRILKALAGDGNYQTISLKDLGSMERRYGLDGALFNVAEETPDRVIESNEFKNLVDGGEIKIRRLYADDYSIKNRAKFIFTCNRLPPAYDYSHGFWRRLLIAPFKADFTGRENMDLVNDLLLELPGIFNMMIAGYERFLQQRKRFTASVESQEALDDYRLDNDPVLQWQTSCLEVSMQGTEKFTTQHSSIKALYKSFKQYCDEFAPKREMDVRFFGKRLRVAFKDYDLRYKRDGNSRDRVLLGIRIKSETEF